MAEHGTSRPVEVSEAARSSSEVVPYDGSNGTPPSRNHWQRQADRRWPYAKDMATRPIGRGRWASVAWCSDLSVVLHPSRVAAIEAMAALDRFGCGHGCWDDHELVDLRAKPPKRTAASERERATQRVAHLTNCYRCSAVYDADAARKRHGIR